MINKCIVYVLFQIVTQPRLFTMAYIKSFSKFEYLIYGYIREQERFLNLSMNMESAVFEIVYLYYPKYMGLKNQNIYQKYQDEQMYDDDFDERGGLLVASGNDQYYYDRDTLRFIQNYANALDGKDIDLNDTETNYNPTLSLSTPSHHSYETITNSANTQQKQNMVITINDTVTFKTKHKDKLQGTVKFIGPMAHHKNKQQIFYGIEMKEAYSGKNNGSKKKVSYFQTTYKRGVFIKKQAIIDVTEEFAPNDVFNKVPIGDIVHVFALFCEGIVCYIGKPDFAKDIIYGINLRLPRGNNNGYIGDRMYFDGYVNHGIFLYRADFIRKKDLKQGENINLNLRVTDYELRLLVAGYMNQKTNGFLYIDIIIDIIYAFASDMLSAGIGPSNKKVGITLDYKYCSKCGISHFDKHLKKPIPKQLIGIKL